jgi:hypothetical protein
MLVDAGIYIRHGFDGIVACFNKDDLGCDLKSIRCILEKYKPGLQIAIPLLYRPVFCPKRTEKAGS